MSRAFVKEIDDVPPPPPSERPVSAAPNLVTPRGASLIEAAVADLQERLATASEEDRAALRRDLRYWSLRQATMRVAAPPSPPIAVGFGVRVTLSRGGRVSEIEIVGEDEADPSHGLIAWTAPLARALEGAEPGEVVSFRTGSGVEPVAVVAVSGISDR